MTTKDLLEELGEDFKKSLEELSFEKAEKGFKKMRDVEWSINLNTAPKSASVSSFLQV
ncbi:MAG: hypothetical protein KKI06_14330 [Euryarchaeota archaeon]|nr:hypothetical protein [Euryarchaeota archaeon]